MEVKDCSVNAYPGNYVGLGKLTQRRSLKVSSQDYSFLLCFVTLSVLTCCQVLHIHFGELSTPNCIV
jgi:hypothetical protein